MGKSIILKKKDGEKVYPISASDLIFDPVTKKNVKKELAEKIGEAPSDGKQYARINGGWAEVKSNGEGEMLSISLSTNQESHEDLKGAIVTIKYNGDNGDSANFTWNGENIIVNIPTGINYKVSVSNVSGYKTPTPKEFTAIGGLSRTVEFVYQTEKLTVNVSSEGDNISGYEIQIYTQETERIPTEYTELEYIESTGNQYINTSYLPSNNTKIEVCVSGYPASQQSTLFGSRTGSSDRFQLFGSSQSLYRCYYFGGYVSFDASVSFTEKINVLMDKDGISIGGILKSYSMPEFKCTQPLYLLAINTNGNAESHASVKLYSCRVYENGEIVRDYIPVKNKNGISGLLDKVNDVFYPSNSETGFNPGPVVGDFYKEETISELLFIQTTSSKSYKIPYGKECVIKASAINNYTTPNEQKFTSGQEYRIVDLIYNYNPIGVFIQGLSGKLYTESEWNSQENTNGIAVITENCSFTLAKSDYGGAAWGIENTDVNGVLTTSSESVAFTDFDGVNNTVKMIDAIGEGEQYMTYAAIQQYNYKFPNGLNGYLGAAGEWKTVYDNKDEINRLFSLISGAQLDGIYMTSTEYDNKTGWAINFDTGNLQGVNKKYSGHKGRPFLKLQY